MTKLNIVNGVLAVALMCLIAVAIEGESRERKRADHIADVRLLAHHDQLSALEAQQGEMLSAIMKLQSQLRNMIHETAEVINLGAQTTLQGALSYSNLNDRVELLEAALPATMNLLQRAKPTTEP